MSFRQVIFTNQIKTFCVLVTYVAIFLFVGLLIDIIRINAPTLSNGFLNLLTLEIFPTATITLVLISLGIILFSISNFSRIMLSGSIYKEITPISTSMHEKRIYDILLKLIRASDLSFTPKLYIMEAPYMNAFASGWNEKNSMIALTTALIQRLNASELEAVMAHELSHIRHGDVRLTLCVGILSNILLLASNWMVLLFLGGNRNQGANSARMILLALQFILPIFTLLLQMYLSRTREYMADSGAAWIMQDPNPMVRALQKISQDYIQNDYQNVDTNPTRRAAYIFSDALSTHPSIKSRISMLLNRK